MFDASGGDDAAARRSVYIAMLIKLSAARTPDPAAHAVVPMKATIQHVGARVAHADADAG